MKIVILGKDGDSTAIVYNRLLQEYDSIDTIIENPVSRRKMLKRRMKKLDFWHVAGQVLFKVLTEPKLKRDGRERRDEILAQKGLSVAKNYESSSGYHKIESVNDDICIQLLQSIHPDIVIVNGTRIIAQRILDCIDAPFINMHMGITPKYRGVHGGYWALYEDDKAHCGVTVHKVDSGVDTGNILYQENIEVTERDNLYTYQYLQAAIGVELEIRALRDFENGGLVEMKENNLPSKQWYHPTFFEYQKGKRKGVY